MQGYIRGQPVSILIDGGSTHNFVHHRVVMTLGLTTTMTSPLRITVGNGDELQCQQTCSHVELKTLGPVLTDYTTLTMKFMAVGHLVELQGEHEQALESISSSQLRRIIHTDGTSMMFHIRLETHSFSQEEIIPILQEVEELID